MGNLTYFMTVSLKGKLHIIEVRYNQVDLQSTLRFRRTNPKVKRSGSIIEKLFNIPRFTVSLILPGSRGRL